MTEPVITAFPVDAPKPANFMMQHEDGRLFYVERPEVGSRYWTETGRPGVPTGLSRMFSHMRIVARRDGKPVAASVVNKTVLEESKPAAESLPAPAPDRKAELTLKNAAPAAKTSVVNFVSLKSLKSNAQRKVYSTKPLLYVYSSSSITLSPCIAEPLANLDFEVDVNARVLRLRVSKSGQLKINKHRQLFSAAFSKLSLAEGQKSVRIELIERDGWYWGTLPDPAKK